MNEPSNPASTDPGTQNPNPADGGTDWRATLPDDIRDDPSLASITDVSGLAKGFIHGQKLIGMDRIPVPGKDSGPEAWETVYDRLGRPADPGDYTLEVPKELAEAGVFDPELDKRFRAAAHQAGLNQAQISSLHGWFLAATEETIKGLDRDAETTRTELEASLRKEYGAALPQKKELARRAAAALGGEAVVDALEEGIGGLALMRFLANAGAQMGEDELIGEGDNKGFVLTPSQAQAEIDAKKRDAAFQKAYNEATDPGHMSAVKEMQRLYEFAFPQEK